MIRKLLYVAAGFFVLAEILRVPSESLEIAPSDQVLMSSYADINFNQ